MKRKVTQTQQTNNVTVCGNVNANVKKQTSDFKNFLKSLSTRRREINNGNVVDLSGTDIATIKPSNDMEKILFLLFLTHKDSFYLKPNPNDYNEIFDLAKELGVEVLEFLSDIIPGLRLWGSYIRQKLSGEYKTITIGVSTFTLMPGDRPCEFILSDSLGRSVIVTTTVSSLNNISVEWKEDVRTGTIIFYVTYKDRLTEIRYRFGSFITLPERRRVRYLR